MAPMRIRLAPSLSLVRFSDSLLATPKLLQVASSKFSARLANVVSSGTLDQSPLKHVVEMPLPASPDFQPSPPWAAQLESSNHQPDRSRTVCRPRWVAQLHSLQNNQSQEFNEGISSGKLSNVSPFLQSAPRAKPGWWPLTVCCHAILTASRCSS
jgi:hypothetical protein